MLALLAGLRASAAEDGGTPGSGVRRRGNSPGPVPLRILAPGHLRLYQPTPDHASTLAPRSWDFRVEVSESSVLHPDQVEPGVFSAELDLEISRLNLAGRYGVAPGWDLELEVPLLYFGSGFLDHTIAQVEQAFGKLKPRRRDQVEDSFSYYLHRDGEVVLAGREGFGLGDVAVTAKHQLRAAGRGGPDVALRTTLKLPTGRSTTGFGGGEADVAVGAVADWPLARVDVHGGASVALPLSQPQHPDGFTARPGLVGWLELALPASPRVTFHLQLAGATAPFAETDEVVRGRLPGKTRSLTGHILQLTPAMSVRLQNGGVVYLGVVEDFLKSENTASDVTLFTTVRWPVRRPRAGPRG
jgi:hypothetical protein